METETKQIVVHKVPADLWLQLKVKAATKGQTLQSTVVEALSHYLKSA